MAEAVAHAFRGGKLMIWREDELMEIHGWPDPWARRKVARSAWQPFDPAFRLVVPYRRVEKKKRRSGEQMELGLGDEQPVSRREERRRAFARFRFSMPREVARVIEPFQSLQWRLLVGSAMSERFGELLESNPVLAYFWAGKLRMCPRDGRVYELAGSMPQRQLADELMLPGSKSGVKLLRKVFIPALCRDTAPLLQRVLSNDETRVRCSHLPKINTGVINLLSQPVLLPWASPNLLDEVAEAREELFRSPTAERLANHRRLCRMLGEERVRAFRSRDDLQEEHQRMLERYHEREREMEAARAASARGLASRLNEPFRPPPVPGSQAIEPLCTEEELRREGRRQCNCVATYVNRVRAGTHYIYRVRWPQRATLSIVRSEDGSWRRGECEISRNRRAGRETLRMVDRWLEESQEILGAGPGEAA